VLFRFLAWAGLLSLVRHQWFLPMVTDSVSRPSACKGLGQRQPAAELLQVTVGLGDDQVTHGCPLLRLITTRQGG
jgi:hypothetical protein